ncbi:sialic acid-binding Ig-like lectin 13 [Poecilia latipinna]|uniref:sialic acid-binding Ig-like lectin 13 n=1 Tax=Poecilia latipinna TaxID=48699 RepID=UPI00072DCF02|nr:PREDICTED: sialic acid-binding Ig-like lectin 13 [Poecilia latipinna]
MKDHQSLMATLCENMLTVNMLLSVFFLPGVLADSCNFTAPALNITAPKEIEALSGSCLQIPCSFKTKKETFDKSATVVGVWMKHNLDFKHDPQSVIFNSSRTDNTDQLKIIGNLREKNCTTLFNDLNSTHADRYFFRVENGPFRATACSNPIKIKVKDSPWSPSINVPSDLKEHQSVTVTCSAFTPCPHSPPQLTWNLQPDSFRQTEKNTDGTFTTKIQETITLSDTHDGYNITCSARYPVIGGTKTAETEVTLSVSYAPRNTSASISPSGLVSAGSWVELSCYSSAKPPPRFTWFRISEHGAIKVSMEQVYNFNATEEGEYYCVATNHLGNQTSSIISISNKDVFFFPPSGPIGSPAYWKGILVGIIVFICLIAVCAWYLKCKRPTPQKTQSQTSEDATVEKPANEKREEKLHYEEVNFLQRRLGASSMSAQDSRQQETVYSQLKVAPAEDLYAHV